MHPLIALAVGLVLSWAVWRPANTDEPDELGWWRLAAGAAGALYPSLDVLFRLLGYGTYIQLADGIMWALPLLPFHAIIVAAGMAAISQRSFTALYVPTLTAMGGSAFLALLTTDGMAPLAMLWDGRVGFKILHTFDALVLGLSVLTLIVGAIFFPFRHYIARMGLVCLGLYILSGAGTAWQARSFGWDYAEQHALEHVRVTALPQPLSPMNWRVIVEETERGLMHDTLINLKRKDVIKIPESGATRAARIDALYRPRAKAIWRVYDRYGKAGEDTSDERQRAKLALQAWQAAPLGWLARYAVFDGTISEPLNIPATCVRFVDLRFVAARDEAYGTYVVCPANNGGMPRLLQPDGESFTELVPWMTVSGV